MKMFADFLSTDDMKVEYNVHMSDIGATIDRQRITRSLTKILSNNVSDFAYNKYHNLDEIYQWIDAMVANYSDMITPLTFGKSYENRDVKGFKISSKKNAAKSDGTQVNAKKAVWWDGG